jgi:hypothetical protein
MGMRRCYIWTIHAWQAAAGWVRGLLAMHKLHMWYTENADQNRHKMVILSGTPKTQEQ